MARTTSEEDDKKIKIMRALSFFEPFTDSELPAILKTSTWLKYDSGDIVVKEGASEHSFYIILKGSVSIKKQTGYANVKKVIDNLSRGQCFGEMSVISGKPRSADVVANEETFILKIDAATLQKETESFELRSLQFKFYKIFSEILAERLNMIDEKFVRPF
jgi:CRP-like cAMP-binding protein